MLQTAGFAGASDSLSERVFGRDFDVLRGRTVVVFLIRQFFSGKSPDWVAIRVSFCVLRAVRRSRLASSLALLPRW